MQRHAQSKQKNRSAGSWARMLGYFDLEIVTTILGRVWVAMLTHTGIYLSNFFNVHFEII